jgi:hypothetical protein
MIWCRDSNSNWQTELADGIKPSIINTSIPVSKLGIAEKKIKSIKVYDPWKNKWSDAKIVKNQILLPAFIRSIVVRIQL